MKIESGYKKIIGRRYSYPSILYLNSDQFRENRECITLMVAECPGGAYYKFGTVDVIDNNIVLELTHCKTVIYRSVHPATKHKFSLDNPNVFNTVDEFIKVVARNHFRASKINHVRSEMQFYPKDREVDVNK